MLTGTKSGENVTSSSAARYQWTVYSFWVTKTAAWRLVSSSLSAVREVSMSTVMLVFSQNHIKQGVLALNWKYPISCDNAEFLWLNLYRGNLATCKGTEILKYKPRTSKCSLKGSDCYIKQRPFKNLLNLYHILLVELKFFTVAISYNTRKNINEGREVDCQRWEATTTTHTKKIKKIKKRETHMWETHSPTSSLHFQKVKCTPNS